MQTQHLFGSARAMALEKKLLTKEEIYAMTDSDPIRILHDKMYGAKNAGADDEEVLISGELAEARRIISELAPDNAFLRALIMRGDIQNLKIFVKLRLQGKEIISENADKNGYFAPELLALMVKAWEFPSLPEILQKELSLLDEELALRKNPQTVSVWLDRAYYKYANSCDDEVARDYFGTECDFINLITLLRMKGKGLDEKAFISLLMPSYKISEKTLAASLAGETDAKLLTRDMPVSIRKSVSEALEAASAVTLQKIRDDRLTEIIRERRGEIDTVYPIIWYYIARQREAEIIRMCCNMRRCGESKEKIQEKVRVLWRI